MRDRRNEPVRSGMRLLPVLALGLAVGVAALPQAATAQVFGGWGGGGFWDNGGNGNGDGLQPREVRRSIADQGFRVLSPLRRNGSVFVADVLDRRGRRERLIVAAADAQILQRFYLDDSRAPGAVPRETEQQPSFASRFFGDAEGALTPPATIPPLGRRSGVPDDNAMPARRYGDLDNGGDATVVPALPVRPQPPIRTVKPRPRLVDRTPDTAGPVRLPGAVEAAPQPPVPSTAAPQSPVAPRPKLVEPARVPSGISPSPKVASRPDVPAPASPVPSSRRPADPLALPGTPNTTQASAPPVRSVAGGITGAPAAASPGPATVAPPAVTSPKTGDVPVAPLD